MATAKRKATTTTSLKDIIGGMNEWLQTAIELGLSLILVMIVVDVLFPGATGLVNNLSVIVGQFSKEGVTGLIALLLFLLVFRGK